MAESNVKEEGHLVDEFESLTQREVEGGFVEVRNEVSTSGSVG